jgi:hypothetical protein
MFTITYRLAADEERIRHIQKATLTTDEFGLQQTHGLFGSREWWSQIADGRLPVSTLRGVISKVYMGSMGDWPEFRMKLTDGSERTWTREAQSRELDSLYTEGAQVEVDYVVQRFKPKSWSGPTETECVTEIRVWPQ